MGMEQPRPPFPSTSLRSRPAYFFSTSQINLILNWIFFIQALSKEIVRNAILRWIFFIRPPSPSKKKDRITCKPPGVQILIIISFQPFFLLEHYLGFNLKVLLLRFKAFEDSIGFHHKRRSTLEWTCWRFTITFPCMWAKQSLINSFVHSGSL